MGGIYGDAVANLKSGNSLPNFNNLCKPLVTNNQSWVISSLSKNLHICTAYTNFLRSYNKFSSLRLVLVQIVNYTTISTSNNSFMLIHIIILFFYLIFLRYLALRT